MLQVESVKKPKLKYPSDMLREILTCLNISKKAVIKISLGGFLSLTSGDRKQVFSSGQRENRKVPGDALDNNMASQTKIKRKTYWKTNIWTGMRARAYPTGL